MHPLQLGGRMLFPRLDKRDALLRFLNLSFSALQSYHLSHKRRPSSIKRGSPFYEMKLNTI